MYLKKTVIASNVGAVPEYVINNKNGFVLKPNDLEEWHKVLTKCLENKTLRINIGQQANKTIIKKYSAKLMSNAYYKKII